MKFEGEVCCALQTLIDNGTITADIKKKPKAVLNTIQMMIKHVLPFKDEFVSDLFQEPHEPVHVLRN